MLSLKSPFYISYLLFLLNLFITIPTAWTILVDFSFATPFPIAFPPTVSAATVALNINCKLKFSPNCSVILTDINALIAPLNTPHISPITSAQNWQLLVHFELILLSLLILLLFLLLLHEIHVHLQLLQPHQLYQKISYCNYKY